MNDLKLPQQGSGGRRSAVKPLQTPDLQPRLDARSKAVRSAIETLEAMAASPAPSQIAIADHTAAVAAVEDLVRCYDAALEPAGPDFVTALMGIMAATFPRSNMTELEGEISHEVYLALLGEYPRDLVAAGARHALKSQRFFPTIAEWLGTGKIDGLDVLLDERRLEREELLGLLEGRPGRAPWERAVHSAFRGL